MRPRVLRACLRAYPRDIRERDGAELAALAADLASDHGVAREALGLVRGGLAERRQRANPRRRTRITLAAAGVSALAVLTWSAAAAAGPGRVEEERFSCASECGSVEVQVAERVDAGWSCRELRTTRSVAWRCTLD